MIFGPFKTTNVNFFEMLNIHHFKKKKTPVNQTEWAVLVIDLVLVLVANAANANCSSSVYFKQAGNVT